MNSEPFSALLSVTVHKIRLSVRFPCSLTFQIKSQNQITDCKGIYELSKGQCTPEQTVKMELETKEKELFFNKPVKLVVFMTSSSGKIPAGSINLKLEELRIQPRFTGTSSIEKCPDRLANVEYTLKFEQTFGNLKNSVSSSSFYVKLESESNASKSRVKSSVKNSPPNINNIQIMKYSNEGYASGEQRKRSVEDKKSQYLLSNSRQVPQRDYGYDERKQRSAYGNNENLSKRMLHISKQKSDQMKQVSKLKSELHISDEKILNEDYHSRLKNQIDDLTLQNDRLKEKIKVLDRKDREHCQTIKDLKQEVERKKQKNHQQQFVRIEGQSILTEKERVVKQMQTDLKKYEDEINDLKLALSTQAKKIEYKELNFKDQLSRINEKYHSTERERQKAVMDLNAMLEQFEGAEKKNQQSIREKDQSHNEQKNKLIKKIETLNQTVDNLKQQIEDKETENLDLRREGKQLQNKLSQKELQIQEVTYEQKSLQLLLQKEKDQKRAMDKQINDLQEVQRQYVSLKKKYNDLEHENQISKKNSEALNKTIQQQQLKIKQIEDQLRAKGEDCNLQIVRISNLSHQIETLKKEEQNYSREAETLSLNHLNAANKLEEMRMHLDQLQIRYNQLQSQSEQQLSYMIKTKQHLESEVEDLKWNFQKQRENYEEMCSKNQQLNNQILHLNKRTMELQERNCKLEEEIFDLKSDNSIIKQQKAQLASKEQELHEKIKSKSEDINELTKRVNKTESQYLILMEKSRHQLQFLSQKLESEEINSKNKQNKINNAMQTINDLQIQMLAKDERIKILEGDQNRFLKELQYLTDSANAAKAENLNYQLKTNELTERMKNVEDELSLKKAEIEQQKADRAQTMRNASKSSKEWQQYKRAVEKALEQLLLQIGKDYEQTKTSEQTILFPSQALSAIQADALKKRHTYFLQYRERINELSKQNKALSEEILRIKSNFISREEELENLLEKEKIKYRNLQSESLIQNQALHQSIRSLEDRLHNLTYESEHLNRQLKQLRAANMDLQNIIQQKNLKEESLRNQAKAYEQTIKSLQEEYSRFKIAYDSQLSDLSGENNLQAEKWKKDINEMEKKIANFDRTLLEKEESILKLESNRNSLIYEKEKSQQKSSELQIRLNELVQQNKANAEANKISEQRIRKLQEKILGLDSDRENLNLRINEMSLKKKKLEEALVQERNITKKIETELNAAKSQIEEFEGLNRETSEKTKKNWQKNAQQVKKLKEEIISLSSEVELKNFLIEQQESGLKSLRATNLEINQEIVLKKNEVANLQGKLQNIKNELILASQNLEAEKHENTSLMEQIKNLKEMASNFEEMIYENQSTSETVAFKQRQIAKLKEEIESRDRNYEKSVRQLKNQLNEIKKEIAAKVIREEEYKKKMRELEKVIDEQNYDKEVERKNWESASSNEQRKLIVKLEEYQLSNSDLKNELSLLKQQLDNQTKEKDQQISQLEQTIQDFESSLAKSSAFNQNQSVEIKNLQQQLSKCKEEWEKQRSSYIPTSRQFKDLQSEVVRCQRYANDLESKNKQLLEIGKRRLAEEPKSSTGQILRQISMIVMKNKAKILSRCPGQSEKQQVIADFKHIYDKIENAIRSHQILR